MYQAGELVRGFDRVRAQDPAGECRDGAPARQEFRTFASDIDKTLDALAQALGGNASALQNLLDLREDHHRLGTRLVQTRRVGETTDR